MEDELHNAHVLVHYSFMCRYSKYLKKFMSQLYYYTLYQKELDHEWSPI